MTAQTSPCCQAAIVATLSAVKCSRCRQTIPAYRLAAGDRS